MLERIIELTAENLGADAATITAETSFKDDLHADSLDLFELAMAFEEEFSGTLINSARMPPARMGSTRSTSCAANVRTEESRSSATKSVTPTTVMSRYCFVFGSMKKSFPGADG